MLLEMLRFVRGYVRFDVCGRYPERFLNITARHGVRLWEVERVGEGFSACMYRSDYRRIRSLARKAGVRLRVKDKRGLPSLAYSRRDRVGLVFGACAFIITVFVTSMFIWSVDISGNDKLSLTHINTLLKDNGLYVGAFKPALDAKRLADEVMIDDPDIGWMAVNIEGSYASVEIKEKAKSSQRFKDIIEVTGSRANPAWVEADSDKLCGKILAIPSRDQIEVPVNEVAIVELYSK